MEFKIIIDRMKEDGEENEKRCVFHRSEVTCRVLGSSTSAQWENVLLLLPFGLTKTAQFFSRRLDFSPSEAHGIGCRCCTGEKSMPSSIQTQYLFFPLFSCSGYFSHSSCDEWNRKKGKAKEVCHASLWRTSVRHSYYLFKQLCPFLKRYN